MFLYNCSSSSSKTRMHRFPILILKWYWDTIWLNFISSCYDYNIFSRNLNETNGNIVKHLNCRLITERNPCERIHCLLQNSLNAMHFNDFKVVIVSCHSNTSYNMVWAKVRLYCEETLRRVKRNTKNPCYLLLLQIPRIHESMRDFHLNAPMMAT